MAFFNSAVGVLQTLVIALGAGLGIWGVVNLMEGYGNDNPGAKSQGAHGRWWSCPHRYYSRSTSFRTFLIRPITNKNQEGQCNKLPFPEKGGNRWKVC